MKPILYEHDETEFTSNGIGRLNPTRCLVTEERNGQFELEMDISIEDKHYADIQEGQILYAPHDETKLRQPFEIYMVSRPMGGVVTVSAHHISYRTAKITVLPCEAISAPAALTALKTNSAVSHPFVFNTDLRTVASFKVDKPETLRSRLGGTEGSILDVYGGEYEWDKFKIYLRSARGTETDVILRYGKNITSLKKTTDSSKIWTGIVPYWSGIDSATGTEGLVMLPEKYVLTEDNDDSMLIPLDMTSYFSQKPTEAELRARAQTYVRNNAPSAIPTSIDVSFVQLWQTQEYASVAPMERLRLCDTLTIKHDKLGVSNKAKVVKTVYDVLLERYDSMTVGTVLPSMGDTIREATEDIRRSITPRTTMQAMIEAMSDLMAGGLGGHMVINRDNNGKPNELLFMDTESKSTAVKVLRINMNGIAFSKAGYNGPFHTAWSIDGTFYADWISAGNLDATLLTVGIIKDVLNKNSWDLASGMLITTLALIGGVHVSDGSIYSGDHNAVDSTAQGFYLGADGTFSIGDGDQYICYKKELVESSGVSSGTSGSEEFGSVSEEPVYVYVLEMLLDKLRIGPSGKTITDSTFTQIDSDIAEASKTASNYLYYDETNGLVVSETGSATGSTQKPYNTQILNNGINFRSRSKKLASLNGTALTFYRGTTEKKAAEFDATDLTFYKANGTDVAAQIGTSGLDVKSGIIGGFTVDENSLSSSYNPGVRWVRSVSINRPKTGRAKVIAITETFYNADDSVKASYEYSLNDSGDAAFRGLKAGGFTDTSLYDYLDLKYTDSGTGQITSSSSFRLGSIRSNGSYTGFKNVSTSSSGETAMLYIPSSDPTSPYWHLGRSSSSSRRYKDHVRDMSFDYAKTVLDINPIIFKYKDGYLKDGDECEGAEIPGFYAEDVEEHYKMGVYHNADGSVENWKPDRLIPAMLRVIQEQQKEIETLKATVDQIKEAVGL